jgi:hypothetical protein
MKTIVILLLLMIFFPILAFAGEIYGNIKVGGGPVPEGVKIEIMCPDRPYSTTTDKFGSFRIYVSREGRCTLTVHYGQPPPSYEVFSYEGSVRYNLILDQRDGRYFLRRE